MLRISAGWGQNCEDEQQTKEERQKIFLKLCYTYVYYSRMCRGRDTRHRVPPAQIRT